MVYYFNISTRVIERAAGVCGRGILQPRGGLFCNHEEVCFATTRRKILQPRGGKICHITRKQNSLDFRDFENGRNSEFKNIKLLNFYSLLMTYKQPNINCPSVGLVENCSTASSFFQATIQGDQVDFYIFALLFQD